jgi:hypothetical protein
MCKPYMTRNALRLDNCILYIIQLGLVRTIHVRGIYAIFGRKITKHKVTYSVYVRLGPTLHISNTPCEQNLLLVVTTGQFYPSHYIDQSAERLELRETYGVNIDKN